MSAAGSTERSAASTDASAAGNAAFCDHCGLPVPSARRARRRATPGAQAGPSPAAEQFCCVGCGVAYRLGGRGAAGSRGEGGSESASFLARIGLGFVGSMLVMLLAWVPYFDPSAATDEFYRLAAWASLAAATPVVLVLGVPYLWNAFVDLAKGRVGADFLVGAGIAAAYVASLVSIASGRPEITYLDTAAGLATLVTVGRWLEATAKERAARRLRELLSDAERPAARLAPGRGLADPGEPERVHASDLQVGDRVLVRPGDKAPADGVVFEGRALLDEAALTGEPLPRAVAPGDTVAAPAIPTDGALVLSVTAVGRDTRLGGVAAVLAKARAERTPVERLADRASATLVPLVLVAAAVVLALDLRRGDDLAAASLHALSVLVIACPCALGIATPLAVTAALGRLAERGILVRSGNALAGLPRIRVVAFDKTGTLTEGRPAVVAIEPTRPSDSAERVLGIAAAVEAASEHGIARSLVAAARSTGISSGSSASSASSAGAVLFRASDVRVVPGCGVEGVVTVDGRPTRVRVGSPSWIADRPGARDGRHGHDVDAATRATEVVVEANGVAIGRILLADRLRDDARAAVMRLRADGLSVAILSGDRPGAVAEVAESLGVPASLARGGCLPGEKVEAVASLRREAGAPVAFVGDGLNDAPALAAADLGIAVGSGTDLARETAAVSLLGDDLTRLPGLFRAARRTRRAAVGNLFWAFVYNVVGVAWAVVSRIPPVFAAAAMVASSLCVIAASARLRRVLPEDLAGPSPGTPGPGSGAASRPARPLATMGAP